MAEKEIGQYTEDNAEYDAGPQREIHRAGAALPVEITGQFAKRQIPAAKMYKEPEKYKGDADVYESFADIIEGHGDTSLEEFAQERCMLILYCIPSSTLFAILLKN